MRPRCDHEMTALLSRILKIPLQRSVPGRPWWHLVWRTTTGSRGHGCQHLSRHARPTPTSAERHTGTPSSKKRRREPSPQAYCICGAG